MKAGKRDKLITIKRSTVTYNAHNEEVQAWSDLSKHWAAIFYGKGEERRQAAMEQGSQAATFTMPSDSLTRAITLTDRISYQGDMWDVVGITPIRADLELTAVRVL